MPSKQPAELMKPMRNASRQLTEAANELTDALRELEWIQRGKGPETGTRPTTRPGEKSGQGLREQNRQAMQKITALLAMLKNHPEEVDKIIDLLESDDSQ